MAKSVRKRVFQPRTIAVAIAAILSALLTSCVLPALANDTAADSLPRNRATAIRIPLEAPTPFDAQLDPAMLIAVNTAGTAVDPMFGGIGGDIPIGSPLIGGIPGDPMIGVSPSTPMSPRIPSTFATGPAAAAFAFNSRSSVDALRASLCLTAAIYYEGANEPDDGQRAIAQVILNRARHPAYPNTVCGVVYQGTERNDTLCQFTFGCDGALARRPTDAGWARARRVAQAALSGAVFAPVGLATHYHTLAVAPFWNKSLVSTGIFGAHIFFRFPGGAGEPRSFYARYRGGEPLPAPKPKLYVPPVAVNPAIMASAVPVPIPGFSAPYPGAVPIGQRGASSVVTIAPTRSVAEDRRYVAGALPESDVLPQYRGSGQWIANP